ncbi:VC0807 family protein [Nonomuraea sp. ATR24]|uniref:VC0807 family protein n=1 Tax=Nonomuraea TaxID=83681 RepID=UPI001C603FB2|nr:VC0807 family protein [Nonomuraea ceibae]
MSRALSFALNVVVPLGVYYGLRALGVSVYLALLVDALVPAVVTAWQFARGRRLDGLGLFMAGMMGIALLAALVGGDERLLLAKEGFVTAAAGLWFLASVWWGRPMAYEFTRPLVERRLPRGPLREPWDVYWERLPAFRRIWRVSTVIWSVALLLDAAARVAIAYTLPVDLVRAAGLGLYVAMTLLAVLATNVHYFATGLFNGWSALYAPIRERSLPVTGPS